MRHALASSATWMRAPAAAMVAPLRPAMAAARPGCASAVLLSAQPASYGRRWFAAKAPAKGGAGKGGKGNKAAEEAAKLKAKAKKKKVGKAGPVKAGMGARAGDMTQLEEMLEQQLSLPVEEDPRTPAELALDHEYAKEHSRRLMSAHKARLSAEHAFLQSRWRAINSLPRQLRNHALVEDMSPWPKHFQPVPWTPLEYVKRFGNSGGAVPEEELPAVLAKAGVQQISAGGASSAAGKK